MISRKAMQYSNDISIGTRRTNTFRSACVNVVLIYVTFASSENEDEISTSLDRLVTAHDRIVLIMLDTALAYVFMVMF